MTRLGIEYLKCIPGDEKVWYRELPGIQERLQRLSIPDDEDLWGWGYFRRSSGSFETHVRNGLVDQLGLLPSNARIDHVISCAPCVGDGWGLLRSLQDEVASSIEGRSAGVSVVVDRGCANVFEAIAAAKLLLEDGAKRILILAMERVRDDKRFRKFALFSDFCLMLLLTSDVSAFWAEIVDVRVRRDPDERRDRDAIVTRSLERDSVAQALAASGLSIGQIQRCCYLNLYDPVVEMKGRDIGFASEKVLSPLGRQFGHCCGADPFINLQHWSNQGTGVPLCVLCGSARDYMGLCIVQDALGCRP